MEGSGEEVKEGWLAQGRGRWVAQGRGGGRLQPHYPKSTSNIVSPESDFISYFII